MSRDIKYIGMDVHKEAIVIAVFNSSGTSSATLRFSKILPRIPSYVTGGEFFHAALDGMEWPFP
jgi:hypothetical protein